MKNSIVAVLGIMAVLAVTNVEAATLAWTRNTETDMKDYQVYACFTPGCVVTKTLAMLQPGAVLQPAATVQPTYQMDTVGKEGAVAVTARDLSNNESGLSVQVPFDAKAPLVPGGVHFQ